jgi:hypothetical protein
LTNCVLLITFFRPTRARALCQYLHANERCAHSLNSPLLYTSTELLQQSVFYAKFASALEQWCGSHVLRERGLGAVLDLGARTDRPTDRRACAPAATLRYIGQARDVTLSLSCDCGTRHRPADRPRDVTPTHRECVRPLTHTPRNRTPTTVRNRLLACHRLAACTIFQPKKCKVSRRKTGRVGTPPFSATPARFTAACLAFLVCNFWRGNIFITLVAADIAPCFMQPQFTLF